MPVEGLEYIPNTANDLTRKILLLLSLCCFHIREILWVFRLTQCCLVIDSCTFYCIFVFQIYFYVVFPLPCLAMRQWRLLPNQL